MIDFQDRRLPPFAWISRAAAGVIREEFQGRDRAMALAVYSALALLSSEQLRGNHDGIVATRGELAEAAGVSDRTVDAYTARLAEAGLLAVTRRRDGGLNLPNVWALIEPAQGSELGSLPPSVSPGVAKDVRHPGESGSPLLKKKQEAKENVEADASTLAAAPPAGPDPLDLEVDRLCKLMSDHLRTTHNVSARSKQMAVATTWPGACRALLTIDVDEATGQHYTPAQIEYAIAFVCRSMYWRVRVKSMTRLRHEMPEVAKEIREKRGRNQATAADPLAGLSPEQRARAERVARRMQTARPTPPQGEADVIHIGGHLGPSPDRDAQPALAAGQ